jgi:hypothetical protein
VGLLGILLGLGLLIWLSYRGWSVLLLAPVAALQSRSVPLADIKRRPRALRRSPPPRIVVMPLRIELRSIACF